MYQKELDYFTANTKLAKEIFTLDLTSSRHGSYYKIFQPKIQDGLSPTGDFIYNILYCHNIIYVLSIWFF